MAYGRLTEQETHVIIRHSRRIPSKYLHQVYTKIPLIISWGCRHPETYLRGKETRESLATLLEPHLINSIISTTPSRLSPSRPSHITQLIHITRELLTYTHTHTHTYHKSQSWFGNTETSITFLLSTRFTSQYPYLYLIRTIRYPTNNPANQHIRAGGWVPVDSRVQKEWLQKQVEHVDNNPKELVPVLKEFKDFIETTPRMRMLFTQMWTEVPNKKPYNKDPTGHKAVRDYGHMLAVLNHVFTRAPEWTDAAESVGMVGVPMCAVFDYVMATPSGHAAFLDPDVNRILKKVLNEWGKYLQVSHHFISHNYPRVPCHSSLTPTSDPRVRLSPGRPPPRLVR